MPVEDVLTEAVLKENAKDFFESFVSGPKKAAMQNPVTLFMNHAMQHSIYHKEAVSEALSDVPPLGRMPHNEPAGVCPDLFCGGYKTLRDVLENTSIHKIRIESVMYN